MDLKMEQVVGKMYYQLQNCFLFIVIGSGKFNLLWDLVSEFYQTLTF